MGRGSTVTQYAIEFEIYCLKCTQKISYLKLDSAKKDEIFRKYLIKMTLKMTLVHKFIVS